MERLIGVQGVKTSAGPVWTESQRESIVTELNRLLADPLFSRSNRCVALLRNLVVHALEGESSIKERTLGVEVFSRTPDYDTNSDPIVRMTANEIRKRLAQYYQIPDHKRVVVIHIEPGSYIPNFEFIPATQRAEQAERERPVDLPAEQSPTRSISAEKDLAPLTSVRALPIWRRRTIWLALVAVVIITAALVAGLEWLHRSSQYLIWEPMLKANEALVICVPDNPELQDGGQAKTVEEQAAQTRVFAEMAESRKSPAISEWAKHYPTIPFEDARAAQLITRWMAERGRDTTLQPASSLNFRDFHRERVMMVGGFDNPWSVVLLTGLRYSLRADPEAGIFWIKDAQNPSKRNWVRSDKADTADIDYAIVANFYDEEVKNRIMIIGGLGRHGTEAAARLLLDSSLDNQIPQPIRNAKNFEVVIKTYQVNGETAPPQIMASYTW